MTPENPPFHAQTEGIADTTLHNTGAPVKDKDVTSRTLSRAGRLLKPVSRLTEIMYQNTGKYYSYYSMYRGSDQSLLQPECSCGCFSYLLVRDEFKSYLLFSIPVFVRTRLLVLICIVCHNVYMIYVTGIFFARTDCSVWFFNRVLFVSKTQITFFTR